MYHISQCQPINIVHENGNNDVTPTGAPTTVQAFADLVQYHDCVQTYSIDEVRLSMASAACRACISNQVTKDIHANTRYHIPTVALSVDIYHKAYEVADRIFSHLQTNASSPTPTVTKAMFELKRACEGHQTTRLNSSVMTRLGKRDARSVKPDEYKALIEILLEIFFPCTLPFEFDFLPDRADLSGDCTIKTLVYDSGHRTRCARIRLNPIDHDGQSVKLPAKFRKLNPASVDRLGTLLHEICHAFLDLYACSQCSLAEVRQFRGHGFAWQRVAYWVEAFAQEKLDLPLDLGRFDGIKFHWKHMEILPSMEEMLRWGLRDP